VSSDSGTGESSVLSIDQAFEELISVGYLRHEAMACLVER
jgi:hypothetical protein